MVLDKWRKTHTIVFTNGCFDILHLGHIDYLTKAAQLGTRLIVGLNSDKSVKELKGSGRPIQCEQSRASVLAALECVHAVVLFDETTPLNLIREIAPNTLVKGADYAIDEIVGGDIVINNGGTVKTIPFLQGYSTTNIIDKIQNG